MYSGAATFLNRTNTLFILGLALVPCVGGAQTAGIKGLKIYQSNLEKNWKLLNPGTGDTATCTYNVSYQTYEGKGKARKLANRLNQLMNNAVTTDTAHKELNLDQRVEQDAEEFRQEWQNLNSDSDCDWTYNYAKQQSFSICNSNADYVTVSDFAYYYTGGAHGLEVAVYTVLSKKTGDPIENWTDIFKDSLSVLKVAESEFRKLKAIPQDVSTNRDWFWNGLFYLPNNFAFTDAGLLFYYNSYEIAPYAQGATELIIPYEKLNPYFKKIPKK
jgi:hypothetical protein